MPAIAAVVPADSVKVATKAVKFVPDGTDSETVRRVLSTMPVTFGVNELKLNAETLTTLEFTVTSTRL